MIDIIKSRNIDIETQLKQKFEDEIKKKGLDKNFSFTALCEIYATLSNYLDENYAN